MLSLLEGPVKDTPLRDSDAERDSRIQNPSTLRIRTHGFLITRDVLNHSATTTGHAKSLDCLVFKATKAMSVLFPMKSFFTIFVSSR